MVAGDHLQLITDGLTVEWEERHYVEILRRKLESAIASATSTRDWVKITTYAPPVVHICAPTQHVQALLDALPKPKKTGRTRLRTGRHR